MLTHPEIIAMVERLGGRAVMGGRHVKLVDRNGRVAGILPKKPRTPTGKGSERAYLNLRSQLRRAGLWQP
jgi:hypothetical protein